MNEAQVVAALLQFYKNQGIDLHYVLDDPVFEKLPLQAKVTAIKTHAAEIVEGTTPGFSKIDRKTLISRAATSGIRGGLTGAMIGASIGAVARGVHPAMPAAIGALTGLTAGAVTSALESRAAIGGKVAVRNQLQNVSRSPSDTNALGALSIQGIHNRQNAHLQDVYALLRETVGRTTSPEALAAQIEKHTQMVEAARAGA